MQSTKHIKSWALPQITMGLKNLAISSIMLGLLLAFTQLVKFVVLLIQDLIHLSELYGAEQEVISRTSQYYVYNKLTRAKVLETSHELTSAAESIGEQLSEHRIILAVLLILCSLGFIFLYYAIDYLVDFTRRYRPWSILILLTTFVGSVMYIEIVDLRSTGNGYAFMFTTIISIISGIVLIGYSLIFPNYCKPTD